MPVQQPNASPARPRETRIEPLGAANHRTALPRQPCPSADRPPFADCSGLGISGGAGRLVLDAFITAAAAAALLGIADNASGWVTAVSAAVLWPVLVHRLRKLPVLRTENVPGRGSLLSGEPRPDRRRSREAPRELG